MIDRSVKQENKSATGIDKAYVKKGGQEWIEGRTNGFGPLVRVKGLSVD